MDRYQKVEKPKPQFSKSENEIRITTQGLIGNYVNYATSVLEENPGKEIVLKAMGQAISKTVVIAEIIKRRIPTLHQDTATSSVSITDVWEPIEEGLLPVETTRHVSMISITLSTSELSQMSPGYQAPYLVEQTKPQNNYSHQPPRQARAPYNAVNEVSYGRVRGRGRGRGWGQNRGGSRNYQDNVQSGAYGDYQENGQSMGGYGDYQENFQNSNWGRGGFRGREWGYRGGRYERGRGGEAYAHEPARYGRGRGGEAQGYRREPARYGGGRGGEDMDYVNEPARYGRGRGGEARGYRREPARYGEGQGEEDRDYGNETARYGRGRGGEARGYRREPARYGEDQGEEDRDYGNEPARYGRGRGGEGRGYRREPARYGGGQGGEDRDYGHEPARYGSGRGGEARGYNPWRSRGRGRGRMGNQPRGGGDLE